MPDVSLLFHLNTSFLFFRANHEALTALNTRCFLDNLHYLWSLWSFFDLWSCFLNKRQAQCRCQYFFAVGCESRIVTSRVWSATDCRLRQ